MSTRRWARWLYGYTVYGEQDEVSTRKYSPDGCIVAQSKVGRVVCPIGVG